jgi:hypothetical protein
MVYLGEEKREKYMFWLGLSGSMICTEVEVVLFVEVTSFDDMAKFDDRSKSIYMFRFLLKC